MRGVLLQLVRKLYPNMQPKNDFAILQLSAGIYKEEMGDVGEWLDFRRRYLVSLYGGGERGEQILQEYIRTTLSSPVKEVIGVC